MAKSPRRTIPGIYITQVANGATGNFQGGITNIGAISAYDYGLYIYDVAGSTFSAGNIVNTAAITTADEYGIEIYDVGTSAFSGNIVNTAAITAKGSDGYGIDITDVANGTTGTFTGTITNSGAITAYYDAIEIDDVGHARFVGGITNSGKIVSADEDGIVIENVASAGTFTGNIVNSATILAKDAGIYIDSVGVAAFLGGVTNTGVISSLDFDGLEIEGIPTISGAIKNTGTIIGDIGVYLSGTTTANLFDTGTITGTGGTAIEFVNGTDTLTVGSGFKINGDVLGGGGIFQLGGSGSAGFNLGLIGTQYTGFSTFNVVGGGWTVSGAAAPGTGENWTVDWA